MTEVIVYHHLYNKNFGSLELTPPAATADVSATFGKIAKILALVGILFIFITYAPTALAWTQNQLGYFDTNFALSQKEVHILTVNSNNLKVPFEPVFDSKLPLINRLNISAIGVDTAIEEATYDNYEEALKHGVWRVSNFGAPNETGSPMILAAHRFGYLAWSNTFRHESSFYNLPKVNVGDTIQIVWRQRKYTYEVYATAKDKEISDYTANLILYTCETLTGPERIFVYARLMRV